MMTNMSACQPEQIVAFINNRLSPAEERRLEEHLGECLVCRESLASQTADADLWDKAGQHLQDDELSSLDGSTTYDRSLAVQHVLDSLQPTDDPQMLGRLGGLEVSGVVGAGAMGVVLKGFDKSLDRTVAIKVLAPHLASGGAARKRFTREAKASAAVLQM